MNTLCAVSLLLIPLISAEKCQVNNELKVYDFIVVGGGAAGCILATRLSENNNFNVLLLEAGGEPPVLSRIPILAPYMQNTEVDWNYTTVPQKSGSLSEPNKQSNWPRGKMLGGSSSLNFHNFFRGNKYDFKQWEEDGAKEWGWEHVLPYYLKVENNQLKGANNDIRSIGKTGNIPITNPGDGHPFLMSFMNAMSEMGYHRSDPNDGIQTGFHFSTVNIYNNERRSPFTNYLKPVMKCRGNLIVKTFAFVEQILFNVEKKVIGVLYSQDKCRHKVLVRHEVILTAGSINTPQLLMVSGIGPKKHLDSLDIKVVADLPVGTNLQDHLYVPTFFTKIGTDDPIEVNIKAIHEFLNGTGPYIHYYTANAFINTKLSKNVNHPDFQILNPTWTFPTLPGEKPLYGSFGMLCRPESRGYIQLKSKDPYMHPIIDPKYLSNEQDIKVLVDGAKFLFNLTKIMDESNNGYKREKVSVPECDAYEKSDDRFWECFVKQLSHTVFHPCGTCKMGSKHDPSSVVDSELKVIGINGIRVADASIMPTIVTPNLQATVMMIAERAADFIKKEYTNFCKRIDLKILLTDRRICNICE